MFCIVGSFFDFFQHRFKQMRIFGGKFRQNFAINGDIAGFHCVDEAAVSDAVLPAKRIDVDVPQGARFAFFDFAVAVIIRQRFHHRLLGGSQLGFAAPFETLGIFNDVSPPFFMERPSFNSWHRNSTIL